jgi:hypothetical protein
MTQRRLPSWAPSLLLAAPLVALSAWVIHGAVTRSHGPSPEPAVQPSTAPGPPASAQLLPGLPAPEADLPAHLLEERVNGAADVLRSHGCRRLLYWRLLEPPAELELLVFEAAEGARGVMEREAGPERSTELGDESELGEQAVYFRRGRFYVRLLLDPGASVEPGALTRKARELDRALMQEGLS